MVSRSMHMIVYSCNISRKKVAENLFYAEGNEDDVHTMQKLRQANKFCVRFQATCASLLLSF